MNIQPLGDTGIHIQFSNTVSKDVNIRIRECTQTLSEGNLDGVVEWVPSFTAITIYYQPHIISYQTLKARIEELFQERLARPIDLTTRVYTVPTYYGGELGPDLEAVASYHHRSVDEVIEEHTNGCYLIYMMGFLPGFCYLGGLSKKIATPRLERPRAHVAAGSVGIAGEQTGIYPIASPGGWRIIGKTPLELFRPTEAQPFLFQMGHYLTFKSITMDDYQSIEAQINKGNYDIEYEVIENVSS